MATAALQDTDMAHWADGTRHYATDDGKHFAVEATLVDEGTPVVPVGAQPMVDELLAVVGEGRAALKQVVRPTVVFDCTEDGMAVDMTPVAAFPAGTSHEAALTEMGYSVVRT